MKLRSDFEEWLAGLCDYYTRGDWFTTENVDSCWRDIRGVDLDALEDIGVWIRTKYTRWGEGFSVSAAIHKAWSVVGPERARARAKAEEDKKAQKPLLPSTPESRAIHQSRCRDILAMLNGKRVPPSWLEQARREA